MIEVTDEMIEQFGDVFLDPGVPLHTIGEIDAAIRAGLEAVMKLIDPVPNDVRTLVTLDGEELTRVMAGAARKPIGTDAWRHECGCCYSTSAELLADGAIEANA